MRKIFLIQTFFWFIQTLFFAVEKRKKGKMSNVPSIRGSHKWIIEGMKTIIVRWLNKIDNELRHKVRSNRLISIWRNTFWTGSDGNRGHPGSIQIFMTIISSIIRSSRVVAHFGHKKTVKNSNLIFDKLATQKKIDPGLHHSQSSIIIYFYLIYLFVLFYILFC